MSTPSTTEQIQYQPGDVANGYKLSADGTTWEPIGQIQGPAQPEKKKRRWLPWAIGAGVMVLGISVLANGGSSDEATAEVEVATEAAITEAEAEAAEANEDAEAAAAAADEEMQATEAEAAGGDFQMLGVGEETVMGTTSVAVTDVRYDTDPFGDPLTVFTVRLTNQAAGPVEYDAFSLFLDAYSGADGLRAEWDVLSSNPVTGTLPPGAPLSGEYAVQGNLAGEIRVEIEVADETAFWTATL